MAADTGAVVEGSKVNVEREKCGLDMSSYEDLHPPSVGGCGGGNCNGDSKDDYVFINGSDAASDDHGEQECNGGVNGAGLNDVGSCEGGWDSRANVGDQSESNDEDVVSDDPGKRGCDGELNVSVVKVDSCGAEEEGGGNKVHEGDRSQNNDGDAISCDPRKEDCNGNLNVPDISVDSPEEVGERGCKINGGDQGEKLSGESDKLNNVIGIKGGESKIVNGVNVEMDEGKVDGMESVEENGKINADSGVILEGAQLAENGGRNIVEDAVDVEIGNSEAVEDVVEGSDLKASLDEAEGGGLVTEKEDNGNLSEVAVPVLEDDVLARTSGMNDVCDDGSHHEHEGQNVTVSMEAEPLESHAGSEEQQHLVESQSPAGQGEEPETSGSETGIPQTDDCNSQPHGDDIQNDKLEPSGSALEEPNSLEADVGHSSLENEREMQPSDSEMKDSSPMEGSECQSLDVEVQESLQDNAVSEHQPLDCQEIESRSTDLESEEMSSVPTETDFQEQDHPGPSEVGQSEEITSGDMEDATVERKLIDDGEINVQNAREFTSYSEEGHGCQTVPEPSEGVQEQSSLESNTTCVDMQSDITDKPSIDCESTADGKGEAELTVEVGKNQDSVIQEDGFLDQVVEDSASVNVIEKEVSMEDFGSEKNTAIEEPTSLSTFETADGEAVNEDGIDLSAGQTQVSDGQNFSMSVETSDIAERAEDSNLYPPVDYAAGSSVPSDPETVKERGVVGDAPSVAEDVSQPADDANVPPALDGDNAAVPHPEHDINLETEAVNNEMDLAPKPNCLSNGSVKPFISFGSFPCPYEAPLTHNDLNISHERPSRPTEVTGGEPKIAVGDSETMVTHSNGIELLNSDAKGVHYSSSNNGEFEGEERTHTDEASISSSKGSVAGDAQDGSTDVVREPFYRLVRIPRYDDEKLREQIRLCEIRVEEKTRTRDAVRIEFQKKKAAFQELKSVLEAAKSEERAARELVTAKRREIESAQALINLARNAIAVEDIAIQIVNLEHKIQHETIPLNKEKELVREIKQLRNLHGQLSSDAQKDGVQQAVDQRVQAEEKLKVLRKEIDDLRASLSKAEDNTRALKKNCDGENALLEQSYNQFISADTARQNEFKQLQTLRKQWSDKNQYFRRYKDDARVAHDYATAGDKEKLERHCVNQVEDFMLLWNNDSEFREEYIKCNARITLRRLGTLDGRALGIDEEPPYLRNVSDRANTLAEDKAVAVASAVEIAVEKDFPRIVTNDKDRSLKKVTEKETKPVVAKKTAMSKNSVAETSGRTEVEEEKEEPKLTREEEELARKQEELRKEEQAARLREQRKLEEKAKAQEALERKRRMAEKAQARAEYRARKEAEQKEKEREKRAKKKEKKRGVVPEIAEGQQPTVVPESSSSETVREPEVTERSASMAKKAQKPSPYTKQIKTTKAIPAPLRNKGRRRMQPWMWWLLGTVLILLVLFFLGNSNFFRNSKVLNVDPEY